MITYPHCKINLGLYVTEKRSDGFHNLESVFYPVNWTDILEIVEDEECEMKGHVLFSASGIPIGGNSDDNLCVKAFQLLHSDYDLPSVKMHLHKNIPMGAGLGGGSSDAAYTLSMLNDLFQLKLEENALIGYARKLGSDCAFFIQHSPTYNWGKGDEFKKLALDLSRYYILIAHPGIHVSTQEAYSGITPKMMQESLPTLIKAPINEWKNRLSNDFEERVFDKYPQISALKDKMYRLGAIYASMSGSGSAVFGIFENIVGVDFQDKYLMWSGKL